MNSNGGLRGDSHKFEIPLGACQRFRGITVELPDSGQGPEVIQERSEAYILKIITPIVIDHCRPRFDKQHSLSRPFLSSIISKVSQTHEKPFKSLLPFPRRN
jgi:hypothetical protein